jgi:hypothetical protein
LKEQIFYVFCDAGWIHDDAFCALRFLQADADSNVGLEARKGALIDVFDAAYGNDAEYDEDLGSGQYGVIGPSVFGFWCRRLGRAAHFLFC